mmetsp:Transcript_83115/g.268906  ORF Transcript_83115/g.268906 Transcript_83115/m.268906 type:complete len:219 (+) Transcript_83115:1195-1851(+)
MAVLVGPGGQQRGGAPAVGAHIEGHAVGSPLEGAARRGAPTPCGDRCAGRGARQEGPLHGRSTGGGASGHAGCGGAWRRQASAGGSERHPHLLQGAFPGLLPGAAVEAGLRGRPGPVGAAARGLRAGQEDGDAAGADSASHPVQRVEQDITHARAARPEVRLRLRPPGRHSALRAPPSSTSWSQSCRTRRERCRGSIRAIGMSAGPPSSTSPCPRATS